MGHADVLCNYFLIDAFMLQWDGPAPGGCALNGAHSIIIADDFFPMLATLSPRPIKHKLRPHAVHGKGLWCLFCFAVLRC